MIKSLLDDDGDNQEPAEPATSRSHSRPGSLHLFDDEPEDKDKFILSEAEPETFAQTARRSGLAWSAGIAFFASVVFMMILGWFADLLFGSSPWGIVGGIVIGSLIGFVQLFRLTSQIFKK